MYQKLQVMYNKFADIGTGSSLLTAILCIDLVHKRSRQTSHTAAPALSIRDELEEEGGPECRSDACELQSEGPKTILATGKWRRRRTRRLVYKENVKRLSKDIANETLAAQACVFAWFSQGTTEYDGSRFPITLDVSTAMRQISSKSKTSSIPTLKKSVSGLQRSDDGKADWPNPCSRQGRIQHALPKAMNVHE
jgi:hypothetical protein